MNKITCGSCLLSLVISLVACNSEGPANADKKDSIRVQASKSNSGAISETSAFTEIDSCFAQRLFDNFHEHFRKKYNDSYGRDGYSIPTSILLEAEVLDALMKNRNDGKSDGLRIYFGAYDSQMADAAGRPIDKRATIFLVETKIRPDENGKDTHYDVVNTKCVGLEKFASAFNHGHLCPPDDPKYCKGETFKPQSK